MSLSAITQTTVSPRLDRQVEGAGARAWRG